MIRRADVGIRPYGFCCNLIRRADVGIRPYGFCIRPYGFCALDKSRVFRHNIRIDT